MSTSPSILPAGAFAGRRTADLQLAWLDAADDACEAYLVWRDAARADQADAFVVYRAALDREEAAAHACSARRVRTDPASAEVQAARAVDRVGSRGHTEFAVDVARVRLDRVEREM
jgi:hypothetical protein